jgi:predicted phage tail protein
MSAWSATASYLHINSSTITGLTAERGVDATQVKLSWNSFPGAARYKVYFSRGDGSKEGWDSTNVTGNTFTSIGNDPTQSSYTFTVYAVNTSGSEIAKASVTYNMPAIAGLTAVKGYDATQVKLSWNSFSGASYYKVYFKRGDASKEGWDATGVTGNTFTSTGNDTRQSYYTFTVYAMSSSGSILASSNIRYNMPK